MNPQNSFLSPQGSVSLKEQGDVLRIRLRDYLSKFPRKKLFLQEKHAPDDAFFSSDRTHSIATTDDYSVHPDLKKYADFFYDKTRYNAFYESPLEGFLRQQKVKDIGLVGLETHTSILFTAEELRNRGYQVTVVEPLCMSRDESLHGFAITVMCHSLGVRISNGQN